MAYFTSFSDYPYFSCPGEFSKYLQRGRPRQCYLDLSVVIIILTRIDMKLGLITRMLCILLEEAFSGNASMMPHFCHSLGSKNTHLPADC